MTSRRPCGGRGLWLSSLCGGLTHEGRALCRWGCRDDADMGPCLRRDDGYGGEVRRRLRAVRSCGDVARWSWPLFPWLAKSGFVMTSRRPCGGRGLWLSSLCGGLTTRAARFVSAGHPDDADMGPCLRRDDGYGGEVHRRLRAVRSCGDVARWSWPLFPWLAKFGFVMTSRRPCGGRGLRLSSLCGGLTQERRALCRRAHGRCRHGSLPAQGRRSWRGG